MRSPRPAQNRALLSLSAAPTTRPLSQHIMSPLYCLLRTGDDNFKVQSFSWVVGGRMEAIWGGQNSWTRFQSPVPGGLWYFWGLPLPTIPAGASGGSWGLPEASSHPEDTWPHPTPSPFPLNHTQISMPGAGASSKEPLLEAPFGLSLWVQMFMFTVSLSCWVNTRAAVINLFPLRTLFQAA